MSAFLISLVGQNFPRKAVSSSSVEGRAKGRDRKESAANLLEPEGKGGDGVLTTRKPERFKIGITPQSEFS